MPRTLPAIRYVYLFQLDRFVKIGCATNPEKRVRAFSSLPFPSRLIHTIASANAHAIEQSLHGALDEYRIKGEWFNLPPDVLARLCKFSRIDQVSDLPPYFVALEKRTFRIPDDLAEALDRLAERNDRPFPWEVRRAIVAYLRRHGMLPEGYRQAEDEDE